jgi:hypothetical protein
MARNVVCNVGGGAWYKPTTEHLQQIPNTTPHPHKTELLREIDQFPCSNSVPIPLPIFGGHQKNTHLPSNKGALATSSNPLCSFGANTLIRDSALEKQCHAISLYLVYDISLCEYV